MTLQSQNNRINYSATGDPATDYSFPFWVAEEAWVKVAVDGEDVPSSDYTVDLPNSEMSFVDGSEPASGKTITIYREVTLDQQTDYTPNGPFPAESHEQALDKLTAAVQELDDGLSRAFRANVSEDGSLDLEVPAFDENKALTFKMVGGNQVIGVSDRDPDKAQDESEAARDAAQAAQSAAETAESNAEGHENGAQTAESGAVTAKDEAETARDKAQDWAEGTEPGGTGTKSAKEWADVSLTGARIGCPFPVLDHLAGVDPPSNDGDAKFIKLTAGEDGAGQYNEGLLTGESVSGSAPLVVATAVIDDPDSPMDGQTVHLLNTENRYLMPGESPGTVANDQMQQIMGSFDATRLMNGGLDVDGALVDGGSGTGGITASGNAGGSPRRVGFDSAISPNARTGDHTNVKHLEVTAYMRIR